MPKCKQEKGYKKNIWFSIPTTAEGYKLDISTSTMGTRAQVFVPGASACAQEYKY